MNQYVKIALAILAGVAVALQTTYPGAAWAHATADAITVTLGLLHLVPAAPPANPARPGGGNS